MHEGSCFRNVLITLRVISRCIEPGGTSLNRSLRCLSAAAIVAAFNLSFAAGPASYHSAGEIAIGGEGGWDMLLADGDAHRLYVSHASKVVVCDTDKLTTVGEIGDTPGVHGIAISPKLHKGFVSNGRENSVSIVDLDSLKTLKKVPTGASPDAIIYEPKHNEVYCFNGHGNSATIIDAGKDEVASTITLEGKPEFACEDVEAGKVYVNFEDKSEVAVISVDSHAVEKTWPVAPGEEPSGIAIDAKRHRLFAGCGNKMMVMLDTESGKVLDHVAVGAGVDGAEFDSELQLAFCPSGGEGKVTIAKVDGDKLVQLQELKTAAGCRTMTMDVKSHRIYLPAAQFEAQSATAPGAPRQRPKVIAGSFKVLVYEPAR